MHLKQGYFLSKQWGEAQVLIKNSNTNFVLRVFYPLNLEKSKCANNPATGGKKNVQARRTNVNFQPNIPISKGNREKANNDQPVRKATIVPTPAPACNSPATRGKLT